MDRSDGIASTSSANSVEENVFDESFKLFSLGEDAARAIWNALVEVSEHEESHAISEQMLKTRLSVTCNQIAVACGSVNGFVTNMEIIQKQHKLQVLKKTQFFTSVKERDAYYWDLNDEDANKALTEEQANSIRAIRKTVQSRIASAWRRLRQGVLDQMKDLGFAGVPDDIRKKRPVEPAGEGAPKKKKKTKKTQVEEAAVEPQQVVDAPPALDIPDDLSAISNTDDSSIPPPPPTPSSYGSGWSAGGDWRDKLGPRLEAKELTITHEDNGKRFEITVSIRELV